MVPTASLPVPRFARPTPKRIKSQKNRTEGRFVSIAHHWIDTPQWAALTPFEVKLFVDLAFQFNGQNNGDLCAAWSMMRKRGWNSPGTLNKAIKGLIRKGWIDLSRQGGRHQASLYALTVRGVDPCRGKLDIRANPVPPHRWKNIPPSRDV